MAATQTAVASFGPNLRTARKRAGMTQQSVCREVGITTIYLSYLENSKATPSLELAGKLAAAVGEPLAELFREIRATPLAKTKPVD